MKLPLLLRGIGSLAGFTFMILGWSCTAPRAQESTALGQGAVLRGLDRISGDVADLSLSIGSDASLGRMRVTLRQCRYPVENPSGDAFAYMDIVDTKTDIPVFAGWMIASSPALNALDHPRYDLWVLRCTTS